MITLDDAADFLRICETENLTRAAQLAHVSPSTLSRSLTRLEDELKVKLCSRDQKGIALTPAGRRFRDFADECLKRYSTLLTELKTPASPLSGSVKIYCSVSASYIFIPRLLSELRLDHPNIEVSLETGDPANALSLLHEQDIDFVIAALPETLSEDISVMPLVSFPLVLIGPRAPVHKLKGCGSSAGSGEIDFKEAPFILPEHGQLRCEADKWFEKQGVHPANTTAVAGHEAIVSLCALGFGLAIAPSLVVELSPFKNDVQILPSDGLPDFNLGLCCLKSRAHEQIIQAVNRVAALSAPTFSADVARRRLTA